MTNLPVLGGKREQGGLGHVLPPPTALHGQAGCCGGTEHLCRPAVGREHRALSSGCGGAWVTKEV